MLLAIDERIDSLILSTEIRDEKFRQDTEGNVAGMFKVLLKSGFWGLKHIPLTKVTLTFNLE